MRHSNSARRDRSARRPAVPVARRRPVPASLAEVPAPPLGEHAERIPLILFCYDLRTQQLVHCNNHCASVLGHPAQKLLDLGPEVADYLLHPTALEQYRRHNLRQLLTDDRAVHWDCQLRHQNGSWHWLRLRARASAWADDGTATQLSGSAEEVAHYYATSEALRRQRYLLRNLADIAPNLIYIYDLTKRRNLYCNRRIDVMLGYTEEEIQQLGSELVERIMPEEDARRFNREMLQVAQLPNRGSRVLEHAVRHHDGSLRWLRCVHMPFDRDGDGQVRSVLGVAEDVTERHQAEARSRSVTRRLAEQHRLFRQVIDALPHPVYLKDGDGNYLLANRATARLYGMTPAQLTGPSAHLPPTSLDTLRYQMQDRQVLADGQDLKLEETYTYPDGRVRWFNSTKCLFVRDDGTRQVLGVDSDITRLKTTQLALEAAKEAAEQNAQAKQAFLAIMSHEIRTPLHGIIGLTGLLGKSGLTDSQQDYLRLLADSAEHLLAVVNDVLITARLEAGKLQVEHLPFEPQQLLQGCAALLRPRAREKGLTVRVLAAGLPLVLGDTHRLRQIILNLVSNAIKFTEHGQVGLCCEALPVPSGSDYLQLRFSVTDTGIGIAPEALARVFEPFAQATAGTDREYGGTGLGLSISQGLVELLGGELQAHSTVGEGSTFGFTLQLALVPGTAEPELPAAAEPAVAPLATGRVLLVEDNPVNSMLTEGALRGWGWQVVAVPTAHQALEAFNQERFEVVLMDMQLPDMDGESATHLLRQCPDAARATTPVIAFTARAQPGEAERLQAAGFAGYVPKPYREEQLRLALQAALSQSKTEPSPVPVSAPAPGRLYDLTNIRQLTQHDETMVCRLAWTFINSTPPVLDRLDAALARHDWRALSDAAHLLKSSLDGLHVCSLQAAIKAAEQYVTHPPTLAAAAQAVAQVRRTTEQVIAQLRAEFPGPACPPQF